MLVQMNPDGAAAACGATTTARTVAPAARSVVAQPNVNFIVNLLIMVRSLGFVMMCKVDSRKAQCGKGSGDHTAGRRW
jgi:hypothetical protein